MAATYHDDVAQTTLPIKFPEESTLLEALLRDSSYEFFDNINTPQKETVHDIVTEALKKASLTLQHIELNDSLVWGKI